MAQKKRVKIDLSEWYLGDGWEDGFKKCLEIKKGDRDDDPGVVATIKWNEDKLEPAVKRVLGNMFEVLFEETTFCFGEDCIYLQSDFAKLTVEIKYNDMYIGIPDSARIVKIGKLFDMDLGGYFPEGVPED